MISRLPLVLIALLLMVPAPPSIAADRPCAATRNQLVIKQADDRVGLLDPATDATIDVAPGLAIVAAIETRIRNMATVPTWSVTNTSTDRGYRLQVHVRQTAETLFDVTFGQRIELAASTHSRTGRFTVFLQANNQASEITIFDAITRTQRDLRLPHDATLAAYAIGLFFSHDEHCLAVSLERAGGSGPETWLIDPRSGIVAGPLPGTVRGWLG